MDIASVECSSTVDSGEWDSYAEDLGAGYHQCHANTIFDASRARKEPVFITVRNSREKCIGLLAGIVGASSFWPFSRYCKDGLFPSLPATSAVAVESQLSILAAIEEKLCARGFSLVAFGACESPTSENVLSSLGYKLAQRWEFYVDLRNSLDDIRRGFSRNRRRNLRDADQLNLDTRVENTEEALRLAYNMYLESMNRRGISRTEAEQWTATVRDRLLTQGRVKVLVTYENDTPIAGGVFATFGAKTYYFSGGASDRGYQVHGLTHLIWTAIKTMKEAGFEELCLGGAREGEEGIYTFKKGFASRILLQPSGSKSISKVGGWLDRIRALLKHCRW